MEITDRLAVNTRNQATLTEQLAQQVTWLIANGEIRPRDPLPSVRQLADRLGISINTVRSAYAQRSARAGW